MRHPAITVASRETLSKQMNIFKKKFSQLKTHAEYRRPYPLPIIVSPTHLTFADTPLLYIKRPRNEFHLPLALAQ